MTAREKTVAALVDALHTLRYGEGSEAVADQELILLAQIVVRLAEQVAG